MIFMFIDRVKVRLDGGNGGNGCVSFYRAKYIVAGGPDGGDGGNGGDVIIKADQNMTTLMDFRYKRVFKASSGEDGSRNRRSGKAGSDVVIRVPVGTIIREVNSGKIMADMSSSGEERIIIKGGRGGRGNQHFATPSRQAPRFSERGKLAKSYEVVLELKLIADAGLIGFPNVGKSTILSMVTNATPKIGNYHFTTLSPNLGVVRTGYGKDFVLADIPGLIEGAHEGQGLGHEFLRHVERTKVLIHVVDASGMEGGDPVEGIEKINAELRLYNEKLKERPQIIVCNKMDILPEAQENLEKIKAKYEPQGYTVFDVCAAGNTGLDTLMAHIATVLEEYPENVVFEEDYDEFVDAPEEEVAFTVEKVDEGVYRVSGRGIDKMLGYTNLETEKGFAFFQKYLRDKGIIAALDEAGIEEGDTVLLSELAFDYYK